MLSVFVRIKKTLAGMCRLFFKLKQIGLEGEGQPVSELYPWVGVNLILRWNGTQCMADYLPTCSRTFALTSET